MLGKLCEAALVKTGVMMAYFLGDKDVFHPQWEASVLL